MKLRTFNILIDSSLKYVNLAETLTLPTCLVAYVAYFYYKYSNNIINICYTYAPSLIVDKLNLKKTLLKTS